MRLEDEPAAREIAPGDPELPAEPAVSELTPQDREVAAGREEVLVLDFGGQYSQLIARRIRECGVFAELLPHDISLERIRERRPAALVLSGGPASVYSEGAPALRRELLELDVPVLGICYGMQAMVQTLGGRVEGAESGEFGRTELTLADGGGELLAGLPAEQQCWMSHRDSVFEPPPGFTALAASPGSPVAAFESAERGLYGIQFHPEVVHTPYGTQILERFLREIAGCEERWSPASVIDEQVERIRAQVGDAARDLRAVRRGRLGDRGGARPPRGRRPAHLRARRPRPDAKERGRPGGRGLPRAPRRPARPRRGRGAVPRPARRRRRARAQAQDHRRGVHPRLRGGGGEARRRPLPRPGDALLGRDRVRRRRPRGGDDQVAPQRRRAARGPRLRAGRAAADAVQGRGPGGRRPSSACRTGSSGASRFPGPGLAIRIVGGEVNAERLEILREADAILQEEVRAAGLYRELWQSFCVLPVVRSVGVQGDGRTYAYPIVIRAVTSDDAMTADWARLPYDLLERVSNRIINEVRGVNRVALDVSSKPPATIEWE